MAKMFTQLLQEAFPKEDTEIDIRTGSYGSHAFISNINYDDVEYAIDIIEHWDVHIGYAKTETCSGVGMEVWGQ